MSDSTPINKDAQWKLLHSLRNEKCIAECADPICTYGCLQQNAMRFRAYIMKGIEIDRNTGSNRYPLCCIAIGDHQECLVRGMFCKDPVCLVSGCLRKPAFHFRDLIQSATRQELLEKLKG